MMVDVPLITPPPVFYFSFVPFIHLGNPYCIHLDEFYSSPFVF
jgi:hypothetical protein